MTNLSQWFLLSEQTPWEVGVYEVQYDGLDKNYYSWFNGKQFQSGWYSKQEAKQHKNMQSVLGLVPEKWRGLSTNPEVKKKPQNKRKTVYRVYSMSIFDFQYILIACFDSRKEAEAFIDHRQSLDSGMRFNIQPLRFRTPE